MSVRILPRRLRRDAVRIQSLQRSAVPAPLAQPDGERLGAHLAPGDAERHIDQLLVVGRELHAVQGHEKLG